LKYFLLGFLNSTLAEYRIRQITSNSHINQFAIKQLPVPRLSLNDPFVKKISKISMELSQKKMDDQLILRKIEEINNLFLQIYGMNTEEISYIRSCFA
jgi:hypothetical protein